MNALKEILPITPKETFVFDDYFCRYDTYFLEVRKLASSSELVFMASSRELHGEITKVVYSENNIFIFAFQGKGACAFFANMTKGNLVKLDIEIALPVYYASLLHGSFIEFDGLYILGFAQDNQFFLTNVNAALEVCEFNYYDSLPGSACELKCYPNAWDPRELFVLVANVGGSVDLFVFTAEDNELSHFYCIEGDMPIENMQAFSSEIENYLYLVTAADSRANLAFHQIELSTKTSKVIGYAEKELLCKHTLFACFEEQSQPHVYACFVDGSKSLLSLFKLESSRFVEIENRNLNFEAKHISFSDNSLVVIGSDFVNTKFNAKEMDKPSLFDRAVVCLKDRSKYPYAKERVTAISKQRKLFRNRLNFDSLLERMGVSTVEYPPKSHKHFEKWIDSIVAKRDLSIMDNLKIFYYLLPGFHGEELRVEIAREFDSSELKFLDMCIAFDSGNYEVIVNLMQTGTDKLYGINGNVPWITDIVHVLYSEGHENLAAGIIRDFKLEVPEMQNLKNRFALKEGIIAGFLNYRKESLPLDYVEELISKHSAGDATTAEQMLQYLPLDKLEKEGLSASILNK